MNYYADTIQKQIDEYFFSYIGSGKRVVKEELELTDISAEFQAVFYERLFEELNRQAEEYRKNHGT